MFSEQDRDVLLEISNIAAGGCSVAFSELFGRKILLASNRVNTLDLGEISQVPSDGELAACSYAKIIGIRGTVLVVMSKMHALLLADILQRSGTRFENELEIILHRIADMLAGSYVTTLNQFLNTELKYESTQMIVAFNENMINMVLLDLYPEIEKAVAVQIQFTIEHSDITGQLLLVTDTPGITELMLRAKMLS